MSSEPGIIDKHAIGLVTGAADGIGRAVVKRLVEREVRVVCADRDATKLARLVDDSGALGYPLCMDLDDNVAVQQALRSLPKNLQAIDILVNSAGHAIGGQRSFDQGRLADWENIIETNVRGMLRVTHALLPGMVERDRGHIINLGSTASLERYESEAVYIASKHAVHGFSEGLRTDLDATGVRVTEILPGSVSSSFHTTRFRGDAAAAEGFAHKFPGAVLPDDVARVILVALDQPLSVTLDQVVVARTRSN